MTKDKRILLIGDTHTGHDLGLTPASLIRPGYFFTRPMTKYWDWYRSEIKSTGAFDVVIHAGDAIHGNPKGHCKSLNTADMGEQVERACLALDEIPTHKNTKWFFVYGTDIHVGGQTDFEKYVANHFGGSVTTEQRIDINGYKINVMHKRGFGKGSSPAGDGGKLGKAGLNSYMGDIRQNIEPAALYINGHTHDHQFYSNDDFSVLTLPAMQAAHRDLDPYARGFTSRYDVGFLTATITSKGHFSLDKAHKVSMVFDRKEDKGYAKI